MKNKVKKQISFDLDTNNLKKYYPKPKNFVSEDYYKKAYKDIKNFMLKNNFKHRQGSIYVSKDKLSDFNITTFVKDISKKYSWFSKVVNSLDVTDVGQIYDLMYIFENEQNDILRENINEYSIDETLAYGNEDTVQTLEDDWDMQI